MITAELVHDADYRQSQKDFNMFVETLTGKIIEKDETIPELPYKDLVSSYACSVYLCMDFRLLGLLYIFANSSLISKTFRIYRDVRFSSDPTPYKVRISS